MDAGKWMAMMIKMVEEKKLNLLTRRKVLGRRRERKTNIFAGIAFAFILTIYNYEGPFQLLLLLLLFSSYFIYSYTLIFSL